jgi:hypothetical protein
MIESTIQRYRAFISYSQRDRDHAKRLHSALETYRVPKGIDAPLQPNRRLGRFFRDDDEMGASTDLGGTLRDALENSENLIVICSPHAARSKWVNAEILHFKSIGRGDRIFAVVVDGTPNSDDPESNCFPPALRFEVRGEEVLAERPAEPLGIDLRKERFPRARLRLVAGLLGISFDSLWQRDKRRKVKQRAIAASATLLLGFVIVLLGTRWLTERGRVHAQRIDRALVTVRDDLASERVKDALTELEALNAEGERGAVEDVLKATLSWVSTPTELLKEIKGPAFISNGPQLFFLATNGSRHLINLYQPDRRVLSSDKRWLLILGADEAVLLDVADGREVARTSNKTTGIYYGWYGQAFETGSGLLMVAGRHSGISIGSNREAFLVFSPQQQTFTVFGEYSSMRPLYVSSECRGFGRMSKYSSTSPKPSQMEFFSADENGLKEAPAPASLSDWRATDVFETGEHRLRDDRYQVVELVSEGTGCKAPAGDSTSSTTSQHGLTGSTRPIGLGTFWESELRWKGFAQTDGEPPPALDGAGKPIADNPPCTEERPCRVQDFESEEVFRGYEGGRPGWTSITRPRGVHKDDRSFDYVDQQFVYAHLDIANAGVFSCWCRNLNSKIVCLQMASSVDWGVQEVKTDMDLRSNTGRWIFYPRGAAYGLHLYDLSTMRDVTPRGPEFVASTYQADFSPDDKRLFLAMSERLLVFEPRSDGSPWQLVNDGRAVQIPALSGGKDDNVAGLLALDDNSLIVVRSSGVISRFDWRTGQRSWGRTIVGVGEIYRALVSRNRRFLLVTGSEGARLLDTKDGLVVSGVLVPPPAMEGSVKMNECFKEAFVYDTGAIDVSCGEKQYRREPITFQGNVRSRLREILSDELLIGSN